MFSRAPSCLVLAALKRRRDGRGGGRIVGPPPQTVGFCFEDKNQISEYPR